jgi:hypothetical protein
MEFYLKEYDALRREIESTVQEIHTIERTTIIGVAAVYTWLALNLGKIPHIPALRWAWGIPFLFVFINWFKAISLHRAIFRIAAYISKIETKFCEEENLPGWQHYIMSSGKEKISFEKFYRHYNFFFWGFLYAITILVPFLFLDVFRR